jgi:hypothetical protein
MSTISISITDWFHKKEFDGSSPDHTILYVCDRFIHQLEKQNLELVCTEKIFRQRMCEALCVLYHAKLTNSKMVGPKSKVQKPINWTSDAETVWQDYVQSCVLPYTFWQSLWSVIKIGHWENSIPLWREVFQLMMPEFIKRSVNALSEAGLMFVDSDGTLVDAAEYDPEYEDYDDRY